MAIEDTQMPKRFREIISWEGEQFTKRIVVEEKESVPGTNAIPIQDPSTWIRIKDVICVFVDMKGSTKLSATHHERGTASIYRLFTQTAVNLLSESGAAYIDVKGDGAFALFDPAHVHKALAAAVTFQTFAQNEFVPAVLKKTTLEVGYHIGIDQKTLLVRKIGMKMVARTDRQNEVWAGKAVNMAAKLASCAENEIWASDRYYKSLTDKRATHSCNCNGPHTLLWIERDLSNDNRFDFDKAHSLPAIWCKVHGRATCEALLTAD